MFTSREKMAGGIQEQQNLQITNGWTVKFLIYYCVITKRC